MRRILASLAFLIVSVNALYAQEATEKVNSNAAPNMLSRPSRDFVMIDLLYNTWMTKPDSVKIKSFGYAFNGYLCYDFPIKKTNLSFAAGLGVSVSVVYLNNQVMRFTDTGALGATVRFIPDVDNFKRNKFATTYLQAPFELRYFGNSANRNKGFKAAIGVEVGLLLGAHTKSVTSVNGNSVKYKTNAKRYLSPWNFAATARIGWGNFSIFGSYNITNVFKDKSGPTITPLSLGLCLTGL